MNIPSSDISHDCIVLANKQHPGRRKLAVVLIIAAVLVLCYFGFYKWKQSQIILPPPLGYAVSCEETYELESASQAWFESLVVQHQQRYLRSEDRIDNYALDSITVLENTERHIVQIDFSIRPRKLRPEAFSSWNAEADNGWLKGQWVVEYAITPVQDGLALYTAINIQRPAAYDLEQYNTSGAKEKYEYNQEFYADKPYDPALYTYKIEQGVCSISFDNGATWVKTPLPVEQLDHYVDGHFQYNELQAGSYSITPQKTAILFGGYNTPLSCMYSNDQGLTWNTAEVSDAPQYIHIKFVSFPTADIGYIVVGSDKTMSFEMETIFKTDDGGLTWQKTGNGPRTTLMENAGFISPDVGFITYHYVEGADSMVYRTEDGGQTWEPTNLKIDKEWVPFFTSPQTPFWQDGKLILLINEGADSDYPGNMQLQTISEDMGKTWSDVQMISLPQEEPG